MEVIGSQVYKKLVGRKSLCSFLLVGSTVEERPLKYTGLAELVEYIWDGGKLK